MDLGMLDHALVSRWAYSSTGMGPDTGGLQYALVQRLLLAGDGAGPLELRDEVALRGNLATRVAPAEAMGLTDRLVLGVRGRDGLALCDTLVVTGVGTGAPGTVLLVRCGRGSLTLAAGESVLELGHRPRALLVGTAGKELRLRASAMEVMIR